MELREGKLVVTVMGAGGKMGSRVSDNLAKRNHNLLLCENGEAGIQRIKAKGLDITKTEEAVPVSDVVVLAVPDALIGKISAQVVPMMKKDAIMIILDPAAAYAKELTLRDDCTFAVVHPCHPSLYVEQASNEARADFFGGTAKQDIVVALIQGKEELFATAEMICTQMFHPVIKCHKVTLDQMAFLEPAVSEVVGATCAHIMKEAVEEAVNYGIPREAAESFMLGHANVLLAIYFQRIPAPVSDACKIAVQRGLDLVFKPDWKNIFKEDVIKEVVESMLHPQGAAK